MDNKDKEELKELIESSIRQLYILISPLESFTNIADSMDDNELQAYYDNMTDEQMAQFGEGVLSINDTAQGRWSELLECICKCRSDGIEIGEIDKISHIESVLLSTGRISAFIRYRLNSEADD